MPRVTTRLAAAAGAALMTAGLLAGCAGDAAPAETIAPTPTSTPTTAPVATPDPEPTETAAPEAGPLIIPACENLVALETAKQALSDGTIALPDLERPEPAVVLPELTGVLDAAPQEEWCAWGIPQSDGLFWVIVVEVDDSTREAAIASLSADARYASGELDGAQTFSFVDETELGLLSTMYASTGNAWITVWGTVADWGADAVAGDAIATLTAANPGLAD